MRRTLPILAATVVAAASVVLAAGPASAGERGSTGGQHGSATSPYVALGDSYSSAAGVAPFVPGSPAGCSRSLLNYPHDIARWTGADLTDVSCSGAKTQDFFTPQTISTSPVETVPPQLDALGRDTRLVTMTIGGNDENVFSTSFAACATLAQTDPTGAPCAQKYGSFFVDEEITQTYPNLIKALTAVRAKAPHATVAILGYPEVLPAKWIPGCTGAMPVAVGDVPYLHHQQEVLNAVVRAAAWRTGVHFVDMAPSSTGHDACEPIGTRWIEPAIAPINAAPIHPNATGEAAMAKQTILQVGLRHLAGAH
jgi:lysophospholipase L1-like esterase